jgi:hypothetical protein
MLGVNKAEINQPSKEKKYDVITRSCEATSKKMKFFFAPAPLGKQGVFYNNLIVI